MINFSGTFDTTNALAGMFLWLIFGFLSTLINCDLQRFLQSNPYWIHFFGIIAFFFLFTLVDNNTSNIAIIWVKTILVYFLFILMTKSRWYFAIPVLILLVITQSLKKELEIKIRNNENVKKFQNKQIIITNILQIVIFALIFIGTSQYLSKQYTEKGKDFSLFKFFFIVNKCRINSSN